MTVTLDRAAILWDASRQMRERPGEPVSKRTIEAVSDLLWNLAELAEDGMLPAVVLDGVAVAEEYLGGQA